MTTDNCEFASFHSTKIPTAARTLDTRPDGAMRVEFAYQATFVTGLPEQDVTVEASCNNPGGNWINEFPYTRFYSGSSSWESQDSITGGYFADVYISCIFAYTFTEFGEDSQEIVANISLYQYSPVADSYITTTFEYPHTFTPVPAAKIEHQFGEEVPYFVENTFYLKKYNFTIVDKVGEAFYKTINWVHRTSDNWDQTTLIKSCGTGGGVMCELPMPAHFYTTKSGYHAITLIINGVEVDNWYYNVLGIPLYAQILNLHQTVVVENKIDVKKFLNSEPLGPFDQKVQFLLELPPMGIDAITEIESGPFAGKWGLNMEVCDI